MFLKYWNRQASSLTPHCDLLRGVDFRIRIPPRMQSPKKRGSRDDPVVTKWVHWMVPLKEEFQENLHNIEKELLTFLCVSMNHWRKFYHV